MEDPGSTAPRAERLPSAMRASAPAKVMLFGEYAVLEGHRALAMCLNRRISCSVRRGGDGLQIVAPGVFEPSVDLPLERLEETEPGDHRLGLLWPLLRAHADGEGLRLEFSADFPPTWGLGSSSASSLAAAAALAGLGPERFGEVLSAQRALQGGASGYDVATQMLGGFVLYRGGEPPEMERLKVPAMHWMLAWTGSKVKTGGMIRSVRARFPLGHPIFARIGALTELAVPLLQGGHRRALGEAMNRGQAHLAELGAVPDELGEIVHRLQGHSAIFGARMTGAGGGDSVLLLVSEPEAAADAARAQGLEPLDLAPEPDGLRMETSS